MAKTIVVKVERRFPHAQYKKIVTAYKKFYAHDEKNEAKIGDRVRTGGNAAIVKNQMLAWWKSLSGRCRKTPVAA